MPLLMLTSENNYANQRCQQWTPTFRNWTLLNIKRSTTRSVYFVSTRLETTHPLHYLIPPPKVSSTPIKFQSARKLDMVMI